MQAFAGHRKRPRKRAGPVDDPDWGTAEYLPGSVAAVLRAGIVGRPGSSRRGASGLKREMTPDTYHVEVTQANSIASVM